MERRGLSGSTLKLIAIITMLIDHIGAGILGRFLNIEHWQNESLLQAYLVMRNIGRIAFPIFCFLLVEGFLHTSDRKKYALRLGAFALISEVPFDLAFNSKVVEFGYQNVFFTLFLGLLTVAAYHELAEKKVQWNSWVRILAGILVVLLGMGVAELLRTDYGALGVLAVMVLYILRNRRMVQAAVGYLYFCSWEPTSLPAFILIAVYNGKRGWKLKYFFYAFYPVHLLLIYLICLGMGIAGNAAV